ncbi:hypothetical protein Q3G72_009209 [Acer saccharum]|nr:hypothetical protein Q3G72_009209 [Acer saccharum]
MAAKVEGQRNRIAALQSFIDEVEAKLSLLRKEMREHTYRCAAEVKKMMEDVEIDAHQLGMVESEAAEALKAAEVKLQESVRQIEEETQIHRLVWYYVNELLRAGCKGTPGTVRSGRGKEVGGDRWRPPDQGMLNATEFAEWICHLHKQPCHVVYTDFRPTPLQHYAFPMGGSGLYLVVDENEQFREDNNNEAA